MREKELEEQYPEAYGEERSNEEIENDGKNESNKNEEKQNSAPSNTITFFSVIGNLGRYIENTFKQSGSTQGEFVTDFLRFIRNPKEAVHAGMVPSYWGTLLVCTLFVKPQVMLKALAERFDLDFWGLWKKANEEDMLVEIEEARKKFMPEYPISEPLSTEEYLRVDADHRLLYWSEGGDVTLSDETWQWLDELKTRYEQAIQAEKAGSIDGVRPMDTANSQSQSMIMRLMDGIINASNIYWRIYLMKDTFYELIEHGGEAEYRALWRVFEEIVEEHKEKAASVAERVAQSSIYGVWEYMPLDMKYNPYRMEIKRYVALLGNRELRMKVLGI